MTSMQTKYVGLDVHKNFIQGCVLDKEGKVILEQKFRNEPHSMDLFLSNIQRGFQDCFGIVQLLAVCV